MERAPIFLAFPYTYLQNELIDECGAEMWDRTERVRGETPQLLISPDSASKPRIPQVRSPSFGTQPTDVPLQAACVNYEFYMTYRGGETYHLSCIEYTRGYRTMVLDEAVDRAAFTSRINELVEKFTAEPRARDAARLLLGWNRMAENVARMVAEMCLSSE